MSYTLHLIFNFTILIAALIGLVRYKKIARAYYPFLYLLWLGFVCEVVNTILAYTIRNNLVSGNIYVMLESLLISWQFRKWGLFQAARRWFWLLIIGFPILWALEVFVLSQMDKMAYYFITLSSFVIAIMSISTMNSVIVKERRNVLHSPIFLICSAFVLYFTLRVVMNVSILYGENVSADFRNYVILSLNYVNLLANLTYALAVLWMPAKQRFSMPS